jgi:hypothetical protein
MSTHRLSTSGSIFEKTEKYFENRPHGFCVEGSYLVDKRTVSQNSDWFESSLCFFEHVKARFREITDLQETSMPSGTPSHYSN